MWPWCWWHSPFKLQWFCLGSFPWQSHGRVISRDLSSIRGRPNHSPAALAHSLGDWIGSSLLMETDRVVVCRRRSSLSASAKIDRSIDQSCTTLKIASIMEDTKDETCFVQGRVFARSNNDTDPKNKKQKDDPGARIRRSRPGRARIERHHDH
jgi:hypothetical protein